MHLPVFSPRRLTGVAAIACAAALTPVAALAATAAPAAPAATASTRCATSGLVIWLTGDGGWAGGFNYDLEFTNLSGHACTLYGYPGVSAVNLNGSRFGGPAPWDPVVKPHVVRLASGATATAALLVGDPGITGACGGGDHATEAAGLRVYPPGQTRSKVVPYPLPACSRTGPNWMGVEAITR